MRRSALGDGREFDVLRRVIARQRAGDADGRILIGPGDDCAVVRAGALAITVDLAVEDVHFRRAWLDDRALGYRSAMAALSDLAAMAARPVGVLASIAVPAGDTAAAEAVAAGIEEAAAACGALVLGGDLAGSPGPVVIDVVAVGEADAPLTRAGAREGDEVWVTGALGGAAAAVRAWSAGTRPTAGAEAAYARPVARTAEALWLAGHATLHAGIDLSDGLAGDAGHIAAASGVAVVVDVDRVPVHEAAAAAGDAARDLALGGGEDYELCVIAAPGAIGAVAAEFARAFGIALTRVGRVEAGQGVYEAGPDGARRPLGARGFSHFTGKDR